MRITSLQLFGVGPFDDTTIEFPPGGNPDLADVYLLVGQNGCGKTTALHALAGSLGATLGSAPHIDRRFRRGGWARAQSDSKLIWTAAARTEHTIANRGTEIAREGDVSYFAPSTDAYVVKPWENWWRALQGTSTQISWAAFAYAGARSVAATSVTSIAELTDLPLDDSLGFFKAADSQRLAQWVANQDFKRLKARDAGLNDRALQIQNSVRLIERAVEDIVEVDFAFHTTVEDLNVRAKLNGAVVEFGLLPDGVKSIVSWIADLLMRMDRIPWANSLPVHQREFLLLLDEIDVHLHPAWQRKLLPVVQRLFPKAQIIASTHSPFVVASLADGAVIELRLDASGKATAQPPVRAPLSMSYSTALRELFGIKSDFDIETEKAFRDFQEVRNRVLHGEASAEVELDRRAEDLKRRGEEIAQLVQFELNQLARARARTKET